LLAESFTTGDVHKIEGVFAGETSNFECAITQNMKVRKYKF
jgi:hypothetical protein